MAIKLNNGVELPDIPEEVLANYPYVMIFNYYANTLGGKAYALVASKDECVAVPYSFILSTSKGTIIFGSSKGSSYSNMCVYFYTIGESTAWKVNQSSTSMWSFSDPNNTYPVWSNHTVYLATSIDKSDYSCIVSSEVYCKNYSSTLIISSDKYYKEIASKIRNALNTDTLYKPHELSDGVRSVKGIIDSFNQVGTGAILYKDGSARIIGNKIYSGLWSCSKAESVTIPENITEIPSYAFNDSSIKTLIIRNYNLVCILKNENALWNTPIANGTGYIYVPAALINSYKTANNWSTYSSQFRAIEDYPDICGTT